MDNWRDREMDKDNKVTQYFIYGDGYMETQIEEQMRDGQMKSREKDIWRDIEIDWEIERWRDRAVKRQRDGYIERYKDGQKKRLRVQELKYRDIVKKVIKKRLYGELESSEAERWRDLRYIEKERNMRIN